MTLKILFVVTGLQTGGAEKMLLKLLENRDGRVTAHVVSLIDEGTVGASIRALGIPITSLRMNRPAGLLTSIPRLVRLLRRERFHVVQGWMYHGNLMAWLASRLSGARPSVLFGVRHTLHHFAREKGLTRWVIRVNAWLSKRTAGCLFNSERSLETHRARGFHAANMLVIPNGFDLQLFAPDAAAATALRRELDIPAHRLVVGMIARFHPAKDHANFLAAAAQVKQARPDTCFALVGRDVVPANEALASSLQQHGLTDGVLLLGERNDVAALNNMFDIACLSSYMEAFPNVLGEAMACGTPVVATDVGDCRAIVGPAGLIVEPEAPAALAEALLTLLTDAQLRHDLGRTGRTRSLGFDIRTVADRYWDCYATAARSPGQ